MDTQGGAHDLFSDMYRQSGGGGVVQGGGSPYDQNPTTAQTHPGSLHPGFGYKADEPSSPGTLRTLFSAAGLTTGTGPTGNVYGGSSFTNGHNDDFRYGRPIESAATSASYSGYSDLGYDGSHGGQDVPYFQNTTDFNSADPYSQSGEYYQDYGGYDTQFSGLPDPSSSSSLERQFSHHSSAPHTPQTQSYGDQQPAYPYTITSPDRDQPEFTYQASNPTANAFYDQSECYEPSGGETQSWEEFPSSGAAGPPPPEPPPPLPTDEPGSVEDTADRCTDPSIPAAPPLPPGGSVPGGPRPPPVGPPPPPVGPPPPPPPPLPASKQPGPKTSTDNDEQVKTEYCGYRVWQRLFNCNFLLVFQFENSTQSQAGLACLQADAR